LSFGVVIDARRGRFAVLEARGGGRCGFTWGRCAAGLKALAAAIDEGLE